MQLFLHNDVLSRDCFFKRVSKCHSSRGAEIWHYVATSVVGIPT